MCIYYNAGKCARLLQMRTTMTVSVWPVGLVGKLLYEAPICQHGRVTGTLEKINVRGFFPGCYVLALQTSNLL